ncbi:MAG TPA: carbamoyl-phosphate synthase large subunit [Oscillospiraceae bacterium]|nr:carbamoyl-phosphate synthase large subunit [Oscillospiraceae bacterium]HPS34486.1 carbamoyl-phosphate synthase large subunit [Oscillospiraceae bacterium]
MPLDKSIQKVLMIGSGPIVIGQAAEFDYAGAQACRVLKDAGVNVVLVNSNPATIMTDNALADEIYLEPLNVETLKRIIEKEKPDAMLAGLGGQTGLTLSMQLESDGFLQKHNVRLIGTNVEAIKKAEDRELFKETMEVIGEPVIPSDITTTVPGALEIAEKIGYPVIVRPAYTLGGTGGGVAYTPEELKAVAATGIDASPIDQILVERYIYGWKEIEFETMRDAVGNVIAVCSMENFDPVGVHTGDSIVVAPALTLSDKEYQMLRSASLNIISALGIVGGCNCQFALNPDSFDYAVIEVNPRVSRSSALASKATGYPIAKITTKIALGYTLDEIKNDITGKTCACFEPTLDYVVVKLPKWPFDKFFGASRKLGTQMKATGEVMSIAPTFEMALMKAVRGAEISLDTLNAQPLYNEPIKERLKRIDDYRLFTVFEALKAGISVEEINEITKIDKWFLYKMTRLADYEAQIVKSGLDEESYLAGKKFGYTDKALTRLSGMKTLPYSCDFAYKMVDTCGAEFDAETPYFYSTCGAKCEARPFKRSGKPVVIVLGSGPIRIGQGIEFDYSSVHCVWALKEMGYDVVIINNNPETVSTDYDTADRLYFEPLSPEDVMNIVKVENPVGVVVAFGGQTAIKLTKFLDQNGVKILGTSAEGIDIAEDRERFDALLEQFGIRRPKGFGVSTFEEALNAANELGYPVLLRPSYVIGGQNMKIVHDANEVRIYMERILAQGIDNPVLVDKYMPGTELEVDVISDGRDVLIPGIMEHIERAGVHSGDSIAVYPPYSISDKMMMTITDCSTKLALALRTKGLVNIQYLISEGELYVIEVNPRASRTVPYISKVTGVPMTDLAAKVMVGKELASLGYGIGLYRIPPYFTVKVPVFSFEKLADANAYLGPEMKSTGEVLGIGKTLNEALFKGIAASGKRLRAPSPGKPAGVFISVDVHDRFEIVSIAKKLDDLKFEIYATVDTAEAIRNLGIDVTAVSNVKKDAFDLLESGKISFVVYTGALMDESVEDFIALSRKSLLLSIPCFTSLDTANAAADILRSRFNLGNTELVDINHMREEKQKIKFMKMQGTGDDYIFIDNFDGHITCPESLCIELCDRHYGVGGDGLVLIEKSKIADAKMRIFNRDGSEGRMAGNSIRSVGKYLYDNGFIGRDTAKIETASGIRNLKLYVRNNKVTYAGVEMGKADLTAKKIPTTIKAEKVIDYPVEIGGKDYRITCVNVGNPHCVVFCDRVDGIDIETVGPQFENAPIFPERVNTEFIRVVNKSTIKMRVYERGNGETMACGTGACAAVVAAVENGFCAKGEDITVKLRGGDLTVNYTDEGITLTGDTKLVYIGVAEY